MRILVTGLWGTTERKRTIMVHPLNTSRLGQAGNTKLSRRAMSAPFSPNKGMLVFVPVSAGFCNNWFHLFPGLEPLAFERKRLERLPPRLNQIEIGGIFRLENKFPAWMGQVKEQDIIGFMSCQIIKHHLDPLNRGWDRGLDLV